MVCLVPFPRCCQLGRASAIIMILCTRLQLPRREMGGSLRAMRLKNHADRASSLSVRGLRSHDVGLRSHDELVSVIVPSCISRLDACCEDAVRARLLQHPQYTTGALIVTPSVFGPAGTQLRLRLSCFSGRARPPLGLCHCPCCASFDPSHHLPSFAVGVLEALTSRSAEPAPAQLTRYWRWR